MFLPVEIERIADDIRREVESRGAELIDIQFRRVNGRGCLTILADKAGGISLDECTEINRNLGQTLDRLSQESEGGPAVLRGAYFLEVNSPGLDRPLKTEQDFKRVVGENIRLMWRETDVRTLDLRGKLIEVADGALKIERLPEGKKVPAGIVVDVPLDAVVKAVRDIKI